MKVRCIPLGEEMVARGLSCPFASMTKKGKQNIRPPVWLITWKEARREPVESFVNPRNVTATLGGSAFFSLLHSGMQTEKSRKSAQPASINGLLRIRSR